MKTPEQKWIEVEGAKQHNLKGFTVRIPRESFTVVTGPSGSGKSSLAFDTVFAEGQRRFIESLSTYARQFLDKYEKPDVEAIRGLTPTIALEQKNHTKNSRSTVGTATEIYDYLRLLYAKLGQMYSPETGEPVKKDVVKEVVEALMKDYAGLRAYVLFPVEFSPKAKIQDRKRLLANLLERGFSRIVEESVFAPARKGQPFEAIEIEAELAKKNSTLAGRAGTERRLFVVADRISFEPESRGRLEDSLVNAYSEGFGRARVAVLDGEGALLFAGKYAEFPSTGGGEKRYPDLSPQLFSFNSPMGACETCKGFGNVLTLDPDLVIPNPRLSISQGVIEPLTKPSAKDWLKQLLLYCQRRKIPLHGAWKDLPAIDRKRIWEGDGTEFPGIVGLFSELEDMRYKMQVRVFLSRYRSPRTCTTCSGHRLRLEARHVLFHAKSIGELTALSIEDLHRWFSSLPLTPTERDTAKDVMPQVLSRLDFLNRVGLGYLTLARLARTLSGGESQRIALANQLGSRLTQTCYVLDEPSIGLHPRDTERLINLLRELRDLRNTVLVVEHDPDLIRAADYLIDIGPGAGEQGGNLLYAGPMKEFAAKGPKESSTAAYLSGREKIPVPMRRRMDRFKDKGGLVHWLEISGCSENNLKSVDVKIPLGMLTCVTGVSGSGKSTAIRRTLYPALAKILVQENEEVGRFKEIRGFDGLKSIVLIDQDPIGRTPRSNPITFMKTFDEIRALLASTPEARKKHYHSGHFSFNVPGGRCETCEGDGYVRVEMVFMEDMFLRCDMCEGKRFKKEILDIRYNGKNVDDILNFTVAEARRFFASNTKLNHVLGLLERVGLGYLKVGQPATTLSGGESQRLKIARELAASDTAGALYVLDEPTTGLHFRDVKVLSTVLHELVERGNTAVVIEHNLDLMKTADWIIDFGPEGGDAGGKIMAEGTPEDVVKTKGHTAKHLKPVLEGSVRVPVPEFLAPVV